MATNVLQVDEEEVTARRKELRQELAALDETTARIASLEKIVTGFDADCEAAADEHQKATTALRNDLESATDHKSRQAAAASVREANAKLEQTVNSNDQAKKLVQQRIQALRQHFTNRQQIENDLIKLAPIEKQDRIWVLQQRTEWANRRRKEVTKKIQSVRQSLTGSGAGNAAMLKRELAKWELASSDAHKQMTAAQSESAELRRQMIDRDE